MGIMLYAVFAYLVAHSKNIDTKRRWRYSILWGVSSGVFISFIFGVVFVWAFFIDVSQSGFMVLLKQPKNKTDLFAGIILFLTNPILISLPLVFIVTFGTFIKQLGLNDFNTAYLIYPVKKHPSDQSLDNIFTRIRIFIVGFIEG